MPRSWQQVAGRQGDVERFWVGANSLAPPQTGMGGPKLLSGALRTPPCESYSLFVLLPFCCPSEQLLMISNEGLLCQLQVTIGVHGHRSVSIAV